MTQSTAGCVKGGELSKRRRNRAQTLAKRRLKTAGDILQFWYDVGRLALEVMEHHNADTDETCLAYAESIGIPNMSMHSAVKMVTTLSAAEFEFFKRRGWPYRLVTSMLSLDRKTFVKIKKQHAKAGPLEFPAISDQVNVQLRKQFDNRWKNRKR